MDIYRDELTAETPPDVLLWVAGEQNTALDAEAVRVFTNSKYAPFLFLQNEYGFYVHFATELEAWRFAHRWRVSPKVEVGRYGAASRHTGDWVVSVKRSGWTETEMLRRFSMARVLAEVKRQHREWLPLELRHVPVIAKT